jgi:hypothetical protein
MTQTYTNNSKSLCPSHKKWNQRRRPLLCNGSVYTFLRQQIHTQKTVGRCFLCRPCLIKYSICGERELGNKVSECVWEREAAGSLSSRGGMPSSSRPPSRRRGPISKHVKVWKEQKYAHGTRRGSISRSTVLAKPSSNLLDWNGLESRR